MRHFSEIPTARGDFLAPAREAANPTNGPTARCPVSNRAATPSTLFSRPGSTPGRRRSRSSSAGTNRPTPIWRAARTASPASAQPGRGARRDRGDADPRSVDAYAVLLGILKAGAAYLPSIRNGRRSALAAFWRTPPPQRS